MQRLDFPKLVPFGIYSHHFTQGMTGYKVNWGLQLTIIDRSDEYICASDKCLVFLDHQIITIISFAVSILSNPTHPLNHSPKYCLNNHSLAITTSHSRTVKLWISAAEVKNKQKCKEWLNQWFCLLYHKLQTLWGSLHSKNPSIVTQECVTPESPHLKSLLYIEITSCYFWATSPIPTTLILYFTHFTRKSGEFLLLIVNKYLF